MARPRKRWTPLLATLPYSKKINQCSIGAEMLFGRLLAQSDDNGNYYGKPGEIAFYLLTERFVNEQLTLDDVKEWLDELISAGLVRLYKTDGQECLHIVNAFKITRTDVADVVNFPIPVFASIEKERAEKKEKSRKELEDLADTVIDYLNSVANTKFRHTEHSRQHIIARLSEGLTVDECKLIIDHKADQWLPDPKMAEWVNPITLFRPTKCEKNLNAAKRWESKGRKTNGIYKGQRDDEDYARFVLK